MPHSLHVPARAGLAPPRQCVVIGAGQAGRWIVLTLRGQGFDGRIVWLGDEPHRPYERPPLSKAVLLGAAPAAPPALIGEEQLHALALDWRPGTRALAIDRAARTVHASDGSLIPYDRLFLAQGGQARSLPGLAPHARVRTLRTWADALALKAQLAAAPRVLVLGGGWIGLEVAASARRLGREVTVLEAAPRLCVRTVPPCVSEHLQALHASQGVHLRLGVQVTQVHADEAHVRVHLADGSALDGDLLVVGIGLVPHEALAAAAGLTTGDGVHTDALGRTADPAIFAAGDLANTLRSDGRRQRLESWENAQRQGVVAAKAALGVDHDLAADGPPWFWSDQFDDNLQVLGQPLPSHHLIERRDEARRARLMFFCEGAAVRALAAVNAGREVKVVRKWMQQGRFPALASLADAATDLHKLPLHPATA